jgi:hypothetical protein
MDWISVLPQLNRRIIEIVGEQGRTFTVVQVSNLCVMMHTSTSWKLVLLIGFNLR